MLQTQSSWITMGLVEHTRLRLDLVTAGETTTASPPDPVGLGGPWTYTGWALVEAASRTAAIWIRARRTKTSSGRARSENATIASSAAE